MHLFVFYQVLSRGVIILHGFKTVTARASDKVTSGSVSFQLSVGVNMAPAVQILAYCVLPSEYVVAASASFDTEMCFQNQVCIRTSISLHVGTCDVSFSLSWFLFQVSLKFSPATAVPDEDNELTVFAQAGSLCGLSVVDQSVLIMESGRRLSPKMVSMCNSLDSYWTWFNTQVKL